MSVRAIHLFCPFLPKRSYFPLIGSDQPMQGLAPCQSNTITAARVSTLRASQTGGEQTVAR